jgi:Na+/proline symporter
MISTTIVVGLYFAGLLGVGGYAARRTEYNPADYYIANRGLGTIVLTFTLVATIFSAWTFFGVGAAARGSGAGVFGFVALTAPLYALFFGLIGTRVNRLGTKLDVLTPVEYLEKRYESPLVGIIYLLISIVFLTAFVATQIIGGAIALDLLLNLPYRAAVLLIGTFMLIYIHIAGMRGVAWSDLIQGTVMLITLAGAFGFVLVTVGGDDVVSRVTAASSGAVFTLPGPTGTWTPIYILSFASFFVLGVPAYPQVYQRYLGARSTDILKKSAYLFPLVSIPIYFLAAGLGVWSLGFIADPPNADYAIPLMIEQLTTPAIFGVALAAGVAALMSTADSVLLSLSSMVSRDVYRRYIEPEASDKREVRVSQAVLVTLLTLALGLAFARPAGVFRLGSFAVAGFAATAPALLLGVVWSDATRDAAVVSMLLGAGLMVLFVTNVLPSSLTMGLHYGFVGSVVSLLSFILVSAITTRPSGVEYVYTN